jgi:hypothetical protein
VPGDGRRGDRGGPERLRGGGVAGLERLGLHDDLARPWLQQRQLLDRGGAVVPHVGPELGALPGGGVLGRRLPGGGLRRRRASEQGGGAAGDGGDRATLEDGAARDGRGPRGLHLNSSCSPGPSAGSGRGWDARNRTAECTLCEQMYVLRALAQYVVVLRACQGLTTPRRPGHAPCG